MEMLAWPQSLQHAQTYNLIEEGVRDSYLGDLPKVAGQHPIHEYPRLSHPDLGIIVAEPLAMIDTRDDDPDIRWAVEANESLHYIPLKALETAEQTRLLAYFTDHEA
eukprot:gene20385-24417_t